MAEKLVESRAYDIHETMTAPERDFPFVLANNTYHSRLLVGTGKYRSLDETRQAVDAAGAEIVTVALRRMNLGQDGPSLLDVLPPSRFTILPNTAACYTVKEAVKTAHLAREMGLSPMVKLEVIGDEKTLFPDNEALLEAARILVTDGFDVMPYCLDDPILAQKLEQLGCVAVMPLASPIGSGLGLVSPYNLRIMREKLSVPLIVDAGVGTASDAAQVMELGADAVLMNTAIAGASNPATMARAMKFAVKAGRLAYLAGRIPKKLYATASSPLEGLV